MMDVYTPQIFQNSCTVTDEFPTPFLAADLQRTIILRIDCTGAVLPQTPVRRQNVMRIFSQGDELLSPRHFSRYTDTDHAEACINDGAAYCHLTLHTTNSNNLVNLKSANDIFCDKQQPQKHA